MIFVAIYSSHHHINVSKCDRQLKVAIVDTGLDLNDVRFKYRLCPTGHKNFVNNESLDDTNDHGTHVAGLIKKYAGNGNYCILIYKYYQEKSPGIVNANRELLAFEEAVRNGADIINFSAGGSELEIGEYLFIKNHPNVTFVVAAGNEGQNIDTPGNQFFPASYYLPNEIPVENIKSDGTKAVSSNWGSGVLAKEVGENVLSTIPCRYAKGQQFCIAFMSGTSMSTAIFTGKLVAKTLKTCNP
jgi:subtilisin family serine protease